MKIIKDQVPDEAAGFELSEDEIIKGGDAADLEAEIAAEEYEGQTFQEGETGYVQYTPEEWDWLLSVYRTHDHNHKDWKRVGMMIMDAMYPFCKYVARRYYRTYLPKYGEDLVNEGYEGMLKALETYDPRKGAPTTWCFREIIHADRDLIDLMEHHTSAHFWTNVQKIQKLIARREREGIPWSPDDLAIELGLSPTTIEGCLQIYKRNKDQVSIDAPVGDSDVKIGDRLVSDFPDPLQSVMEGEDSNTLHKAMLKYLDDKEYLAVYYAYGFEGDDPKSAPEIVKATAGMAPRFRIRQQEVRGLLNSARFKLQRGLVSDRSLDDDINERSVTKPRTADISFLRSDEELREELDSFDFSDLLGAPAETVEAYPAWDYSTPDMWSAAANVTSSTAEENKQSLYTTEELAKLLGDVFSFLAKVTNAVSVMNTGNIPSIPAHMTDTGPSPAEISKLLNEVFVMIGNLANATGMALAA